MHKPTDQELDISVAAMLRFGVTLSALVVFAGGLLYLQHPWVKIPAYSHLHAAVTPLCTVTGIVGGAIHLQPRSLIQLGLVLLIATPVARVVFCVVGFARQRDLLYVAVSSVVLIVLIFGLTQGAL
ncbi:MAG: DUF1634 domain-containing protein [Terracidiphilus sp.]